jgi:hypothetical protein
MSDAMNAIRRPKIIIDTEGKHVILETIDASETG